MTSIAIFDYGVGNLFSLRIALEKEAAQPEIVTSLPQPFPFDALILPGVGGFGPVARRIRDERPKIGSLMDQGVPVLGICLGMQLFFESSEEGEGEGLGFFSGKVRRLPGSMKIPHMGWNRLKPTRPSRLLNGLEGDPWVYYVHSYYPVPAESSVVVASSEYGVTFASVVERDLLFGTQFHPEKSGDAGAQMMRNFLATARARGG